jgi:hypothetical protein
MRIAKHDPVIAVQPDLARARFEPTRAKPPEKAPLCDHRHRFFTICTTARPPSTAQPLRHLIGIAKVVDDRV